MKNIVIIGARGMGRTIYNYLLDIQKSGEDLNVKGFLDDKNDALNSFAGYPPILNSVENYEIEQGDLFISSLGDVIQKKKYSEMILAKGGMFYTLIHPLARIEMNVKIGVGTIIGPYGYVGCDAEIGDYCLIQAFAGIGHDSIIGNWSRIDTHVTCVGGSRIGECVTVHTSAVVSHHVKVEDNACIGALSFVIKSVKQGVTVYGNPAKQLY